MNVDELIQPLLEDNIDEALDMIATYADELTQDDVDTLMNAAEALDPTYSGIAAEVRDAIRDNTEHDFGL